MNSFFSKLDFSLSKKFYLKKGVVIIICVSTLLFKVLGVKKCGLVEREGMGCVGSSIPVAFFKS